LPLLSKQIGKHATTKKRLSTQLKTHNIVMFYGSAKAAEDSQRILSDPYVFDLWHDVKGFSDSVLDLPEVDVALASSLEKMRAVDYVEQFTASQIKVLRNTSTHTQVHQHDNNCPDRPYSRDHFFSLLPLALPLSSLTKANNSLLSNISLKQLKKDFERDKVVINGNRLIGAASTFEGVLSEIEDILDRNLLNCMMPLLPSSIKRNLAIQTLTIASRTNSSGIAFEALRSLIGKISSLSSLISFSDPCDCLLLPVSSFVRSIGIHITLSSVDDSVENSGFRINVQVSSFYRLTSPSNLEQVDDDCQNSIIEIIYRNTLTLNIDPRHSKVNSCRNFESSDFTHGSLVFDLLKTK
jgi:hypothetical protein